MKVGSFLLSKEMLDCLADNICLLILKHMLDKNGLWVMGCSSLVCFGGSVPSGKSY